MAAAVPTKRTSGPGRIYADLVAAGWVVPSFLLVWITFVVLPLLIVEVHSPLLILMLIIMQRVLIFSMHSQLQYDQLQSKLQLSIDVKLFQ